MLVNWVKGNPLWVKRNAETIEELEPVSVETSDLLPLAASASSANQLEAKKVSNKKPATATNVNNVSYWPGIYQELPDVSYAIKSSAHLKVPVDQVPNCPSTVQDKPVLHANPTSTRTFILPVATTITRNPSVAAPIHFQEEKLLAAKTDLDRSGP